MLSHGRTADEDGGGVSAEGVHEPGPRAIDLARLCLASQLGHDLADLSGAGGTTCEPLRPLLRPRHQADAGT